MDRTEKIILVAGASGHQGGASARHLLDEGWPVRALTRDPDQPSIRALAQLGAEVVHGDLMDRDSLDLLLQGVYGVHSVETPRELGPEGEVQEGRNLVDAAKAAEVQHFVYSSHHKVDQPDPPEPWVRSKQELEAYLRDSGLRWTVWRPGSFMEDFLPQRESIVGGVMRGPDAPDMLKQYIAVDDIGRFVALSFREPEAWLGKTTVIAGDRMTVAEVAHVFGRVLGHEVRYEQTELPAGMPAPAPPTSFADIDRLRSILPGLKTLDDWAAAVDWEVERAGTSRTGRVGLGYGMRM